MNNLVKVNLHGDLGEKIGKSWELNIDSVKAAIHAINCITNNALDDYFLRNNKFKARYRILINGKDFKSPVSEINEKNVELIQQTNLIYKINNLETIDFIPFIENSDSKTIGIILIVLAVIILIASGGSLWLISLALVAAGVSALIARPPEFQNFRNVDKFGNQSYLFSGPTNIVGEGGPVPVGYGRMIVGSQVISSSYKIQDYQTFRDKQ